MDHVSLVPLSSALTAISPPSHRQLNDADWMELAVLVEQTAKRYPNQDMTESMEGYLQDFEQVALKYSLPRFRDALAALRIKPGQGFFPRPDEVVAEIEARMDARRSVQDRERQARRRATEIEEFWRWAPGWMEFTGNTEEELLRRFPSFRGTKPHPTL